jgi:hypothetical protein
MVVFYYVTIIASVADINASFYFKDAKYFIFFEFYFTICND